MRDATKIALLAALTAEKISLSARLAAARNFTMNTDMHVEVKLLKKQLEAIEQAIVETRLAIQQEVRS